MEAHVDDIEHYDVGNNEEHWEKLRRLAKTRLAQLRACCVWHGCG
jgi:hypothetical protein